MISVKLLIKPWLATHHFYIFLMMKLAIHGSKITVFQSLYAILQSTTPLLKSSYVNLIQVIFETLSKASQKSNHVKKISFQTPLIKNLSMDFCLIQDLKISFLQGDVMTLPKWKIKILLFQTSFFTKIFLQKNPFQLF